MKTLRIVLVGLIALAAGALASGHAQTLLYTLDTPDPQPSANFGQVVAVGDVDGDGRADIAVGAPGRRNEARGYVFSGLDGSLLVTLNNPLPQSGTFGTAVGVGDVNGDGKGDIAVGANGEDVGGVSAAGRTYVFSGLDGSLLLTLSSPNPQLQGFFGRSVGVGDVNGDGKGDVAVGANGEDVGGNDRQGRAYVFSGADGSLLLTLDTPNPQATAQFGWSLAVRDVNGDGKADIAVGADLEDVTGNMSQGRAYVFSGAEGALLLTLDTPNPQAFATFGKSVAVGDVNADGKGDIAVGADGENVGGNDWQGRAYVFSGADGSLLFTLDTPNPQASAQFGLSLAVGDVDGDGKADIAVGGPAQRVGPIPAGRAYVFSGADAALLLTLDTLNPQAVAAFGCSVAVGDVDGDSDADIAVGAKGEDVGGNENQGRAYVFSSRCHPGVDSDLDGFDDDVECYLDTHSLDDCPDDLSDDAWPPDINMNTVVDMTDALLFLAAFPSAEGMPNYSQRLDMAAPYRVIDVTDAITFLMYFPGFCTNP